MARIGRGGSGAALVRATPTLPQRPAAPPPGLLSDPMHGSAWITTQLRQAILGGDYSHGEKLPAERQLAEAFKASRTTVRAALEQLQAQRLVIRRVGSGTFVNHRGKGAAGDVAELTSPLELIEVRLGIEPQMARLAVLNATARDIDRLAGALTQMEQQSTTPESFTLLDEEFHQLIAESTHNPLMVWLYAHINEIRTHGQWTAMRDKVLTSRRIGEYNQQHRNLYEAIRRRDVESAIAIVTNHLHYARRQLIGVEEG
jgi:DNA-binding FadR family transcriptional regulator